MTEMKKIEDKLNEIVPSLYLSQRQVLAKFISQIVKAELEKILEQGHGGGNWRRLIMEAIEKL